MQLFFYNQTFSKREALQESCLTVSLFFFGCFDSLMTLGEVQTAKANSRTETPAAFPSGEYAGWKFLRGCSTLGEQSAKRFRFSPFG